MGKLVVLCGLLAQILFFPALNYGAQTVERVHADGGTGDVSAFRSAWARGRHSNEDPLRRDDHGQ